MSSKPAKYVRRRRTRPGSPPGVLTIDPAAPKPRMTVTRFDAQGVSVEEAPDLASLRPPKTGAIWLNVDGLGDADTLHSVARIFGLHPLAMEDVVNLHQRPKLEGYDGHLFVVMRMPEAKEGFASEQVSMFVGAHFVVTFQEHPGDVFNPVRARLRNPLSPIRERGSGYLAYALLDAVTDSYFPVLEALGGQLEGLEDAVVTQPRADQIKAIHALKHQLMLVRGAVWPLRDLLSSLARDESGLFSESTRLYLRDCHDHTFQLVDVIETYREIASGLVDLHLSSQANSTNEVMRVLTLIATIFIPLTFIAGVYGMNFAAMPELQWRWGYPVVMALMAALAVVLIAWFRRKGWLGHKP